MKYYLGLDMGTDSVGWAVTDEHYNIVRAKGKDLWGIREFEEAKTAADRRMQRTSRRRLEREKARIGLLKDYFKDEIDKVDPSFYARLDNSFFKIEDKAEEVQYKNIFFNDKDFTDKDYYKKYPTIFHLISELIHDKTPHDVRLVYLACLNIYKHRGNFLNPALSKDNTKINIADKYQELKQALSEQTDIILPEMFNENSFKVIMCDSSKRRTLKYEGLKDLFSIEKSDKQILEIFKAIAGLKVNAKNIFSLDTEEKIEFSFYEGNFDDKAPDLEKEVGEDFFNIIALMKEIYDACEWDTVMAGYEYLSDSRVASYEKHKKDLVILKRAFRNNKSKDDYERFFRTDEDGTYGDYAGSNNSGEKHRRRGSKHRQEDFYDSVKKEFKGLEKNGDPDIDYILTEISNGTFMPKQLTPSNGVIPFQAHYKELNAILNNASNYLGFLNDIDSESGQSVKADILQIFEFKLPYYIGPVTTKSTENGGNGWVIRKENGKVLPWNIEQKIDTKATSEAFIQRMVRKCTFLSDEKVLPKSSLLYEKFSVLNAINAISIKGERISTNIKQDLYHDKFENGKKVTKTQIVRYLNGRGLDVTENDITGIDDIITSQLSTYHRFYQIFGDDMKKDSYKNMAEDIIYLSTIFGDEKNFIKDKIKEKYGDKLSDEQIKKVLSIKCTDWGKLSKEFLELKGCKKDTGEEISIIEAMWETSMNLMELINSDDYTFGEILNERQTKAFSSLKELKPEDLDDMYFSAPVKRMVWQTLLIIKELEQVLGSAPERVFVEVTRFHEESKRAVSREKMLLDLYKNEDKYWKDIISEASVNGRLRSKRMYLYLKQQGKDLYTGKEIPLDEVFNKGKYDIDHIYPQSLTKDDSLDNNMVLTDKSVNNHKQNIYPLEKSIRDNCHSLWVALHAKGFINDEKYKRLTGNQPLTDEQLEGFIARQLVETSQGTKAICDILTQALPDTKIIYSKAKVVSDFRNQYHIYKSRIANDLHHAHDAYLNVVVGNSYYVKFTDSPHRFIKERFRCDGGRYNYNLATFFESDVSNGKETAWIGSGDEYNNDNEKGTILTVRKMLKKTSPMMTRLTFVNHGGISDQTLISAEKCKKESYLPIKVNDTRFDVTKYGGYQKINAAYFFLVESNGKKEEKVRTFETVPVYLAVNIEKNPATLEEYCRKVLKLQNVRILVRKIKIQSLIKYNGYLLNISGKTNDRLFVRNATNLFIEQKYLNYIKKIEKYKDQQVLDEEINKDNNIELFDYLDEKHNKGILLHRPNPIGKKLAKGREKFVNLSIEEQLNVLYEILNATAIIAGCGANLNLIGEAAKTGVMTIGKNISQATQCCLINQSVTGIYTNTIDLLKI